ncbi:ionic transporter [Kaistia geumhonensis]|uniref:Ca2+:H+ antiporter n=1 Tax=Kaistia geumhonensis TaxID=410839 RepID=A0ABU0M2N6_9HYPH|nr:ionic transporter [Kaistia geumhonensis]MCX5479550.1 ionic transporter [Kaistia geumhonensis]MDQ0515227.1 Ca2+:H+ antiporter [Kaistia geumhonensis]
MSEHAAPSQSAARRRTGLIVKLGFPPLALVLALLLHASHTEIGSLPSGIAIGFPLFIIAIMVVTVFVVLRHAEAVAHRVGEPFGTLVLTIAVTAIEASVIVSMMLHGSNNPTLARESVFSTVMIVCAGVVGICLTIGGLRHREQDLKRQGTSALLAVVLALSMLTLVLPDYTLAAPVGNFSTVQLALVSLLCLLLYGSFLFAQMTRHREDFLDAATTSQHGGHDPHAASSSLVVSLVMLGVGLLGIVLLAEYVAAGIEQGLAALEVPQADAVVGAFIATLVLLPESIAAIKASYRNELQRSLNIALGSACATIGLTVPVVALASLVTGRGVTLGLAQGDIVLLAVALLVSMVSFGTGRTNALTGGVHLVIFVAYLLLIAVP